MKKYNCPYCNKQYHNAQQYGGHIVSCRENPKYEQSRQKLKRTVTGKPHPQRITKNNKQLRCQKCGMPYTVYVSDKAFNAGNYTKHCSRSCANGRIKTEEVKQKVRESLKNFYSHPAINPLLRECRYCKSMFASHHKNGVYCKQCIQKRKRNDVYDTFICESCGVQTTVKFPKRHNKCYKCKVHETVSFQRRSQFVKKGYRRGNNYIAGGTTTWITVETSNGVIKVQGTYETRACRILDEWKSLKRIYDWEYTRDKVQYIGVDGKQHNYLIDFKVFTDSDSYYYIETKGWVKENDPLKWQAVKEQGDVLQVWFEKDLKKYQQELRSSLVNQYHK